ncbi:MAG: hypothetical protein KC422_23385, partial [Trueperaceae bacterium]|nr:hypothetical protein [Trueperaceae bacterium]
MRLKFLMPVLCLMLASCSSLSEGVSPPTLNRPDTPDSFPSFITDTLNLSTTLYNYAEPTFPAHFSNALLNNFDNTPATNQLDDRIATLGRVLFYDTRLSANDTISCASCHQQASAFSDNAQFSDGFAGGQTSRNSMSLINSRFYDDGRFFWDERATSLEAQTLMPIQNEIEMGLSLQELSKKLSATDTYPYLFDWAFGDASVSSERVSLALAQFVRSIVSYESKFDAGMAITGDVLPPFPNFTREENLGKALFFSRRTNCAACHMDNGRNNNGVLNQAFFFMDQPRNNGLESGPSADNGVGDISNRNRDIGLFKSPSLRNVELTAPYMHDGRFDTLEQVIDHYNTGIQNNPNLDNRLR